MRHITALVRSAVLAATLAPAVASGAVSPDWYTTETIMRHFIASQYLSEKRSISGGVLDVPDVFTGARGRIAFANAVVGTEQMLPNARISYPRITLGGVWRDDQDPDIRSLLSVNAHSFSVSIGETVAWRNAYHTAFSVYTDLGYQQTRNRIRSGIVVAEDFQMNWEAHTLTSIVDVEMSQSIALFGDPFPMSMSEDPSRVWLRLQTRFANVTQYGFSGGLFGDEHFLNAFVWTSGAELVLPVGVIAGNLASVSPFIQYMEFHDDGNRAFSEDGRVFRAGLRASFRPAANLHSRNRRGGLIRSASSFDAEPDPFSSAGPVPSRFFLLAAAYWGKKLSGFQLSAGFHF